MTKPEPKPSRAIASAALVVACFLLPAAVVSHGHDDGNLDGHDHHCVLCSLRDHSVLVVPVAPALAAPAPLAPVDTSDRAECGLWTALDSGLTRGPPA
ncbi:MAG: hypothetical protein OXH69_26255 [Acidobacteria bacterium]|nr:hypothetical protein [Acidobacteriota bacterium]